MKRFLLALAAVVAVTLTASAQRPEIQVGYGGYTQMDATDMHDGWHSVNNAWGGVTFGINFNIGNKLAVGPSYTFSSTTTKGANHSNIAYHVIMLNVRYNYYRTSLFTLYAHGALGADISHMQPRGLDSYNKGYCAFQISPVGANVGISRVCTLFGEVGFGAQGLVQVGLRIGL